MKAPEIPKGWRRLGPRERLIAGDSWMDENDGAMVEAISAITLGWTVARATRRSYPKTIFYRRLKRKARK